MTQEIHTIAVIGAGQQGRRIVSVAVCASYRTILEDVSPERLAAAAAWISRTNPGARARLTLASTVEKAVRAADLIIEAVADEMEMKVEMFTIFDKFATPEAILATSSPSLIAELAAVTLCPERCIGLRLLASSEQPGALELTPGPHTSEETVARCRAVSERMRKKILTATGLDAGLK